MLEPRVGTMLSCPIFGCKVVIVEIANAGVIGGDPVVTGEDGGEYVVHVPHDGNVSVEEDNCFIAGEGKYAELDPRIFEAVCYVSDLMFGGWKQLFDGFDFEKSIVGGLEFEGSDRGLRKGFRYQDNERILGLVLLQGVSEDKDARCVRWPREQSSPRPLLKR